MGTRQWNGNATQGALVLERRKSNGVKKGTDLPRGKDAAETSTVVRKIKQL